MVKKLSLRFAVSTGPESCASSVASARSVYCPPDYVFHQNIPPNFPFADSVQVFLVAPYSLVFH